MEATVVTPMLTLFRSDEPSYQPVHPSKSLQLEDGDPQASLGKPEAAWIGGPGHLGAERAYSGLDPVQHG